MSAFGFRALRGGPHGAWIKTDAAGRPYLSPRPGRSRILAVGSATRTQQAPNVPTLAELGVTGFDVDLWYGVLAPAGTPKDIIDRYNAVFNEILAQPNVRAALEKQGLTARGGAPERLAELIAKDRPRWAKVVRDAQITAE